jgi:hypothetical protein
MWIYKLLSEPCGSLKGNVGSLGRRGRLFERAKKTGDYQIMPPAGDVHADGLLDFALDNQISAIFACATVAATLQECVTRKGLNIRCIGANELKDIFNVLARTTGTNNHSGD